jgi:hypothetical protein
MELSLNETILIFFLLLSKLNSMASTKDLKILTVKKSYPKLYEKVMKGEMSIQDAYNETKRIQLGLSEFRGKNSKKKEFATDFKRIIQLHNPSSEELVVEIKKAFPLTWKEFLK